MTKIKLCGLSRECDIDDANRLQPDYIGFVFAAGSRRYVTPEQAYVLRQRLASPIQAVGVFVNESPEIIARLLQNGTIDMAQLHGSESDHVIRRLRQLTEKPVFRAFRIRSEHDVRQAEESPADSILLDGGAGDGLTFDWQLLSGIGRPYFLAGGLTADNVGQAIRTLHPYGVDVSSGIETDGKKDFMKMAAFVAAVRKEETV